MNQTEKFLFDCHGFIHIPEFLAKDEIAALQGACLRLEKHALACEDRAPRFLAPTCGFEFWQGEEFGYFELADKVTTGRSLLPQNKNPDALELVRGKSGRLVGNLAAWLTTMKVLPSGYN